MNSYLELTRIKGQMLVNPLCSRCGVGSHKRVDRLLSLSGIADIHLAQLSMLGISDVAMSFIGLHLTQSLVARDVVALEFGKHLAHLNV